MLITILKLKLAIIIFMKIKKIGHCCLRIEEQETVILTDPGVFSTLQNEEQGIDIVLITHEHGDHLHIESFSCGHAEIYPSIDPVWNSGFFISEKLFTAGILKVLNFTLWQKNV